jgi:hypothetical protein
LAFELASELPSQCLLELARHLVAVSA